MTTDSRYVKVVVLILGEILEELHQEVVVVEGSLVVVCVIVHVRIVRVGEAHTHRGLHWEHERQTSHTN